MTGLTLSTDQSLATEVLHKLAHTEVVSLTDGLADLPRAPGIYLVGLGAVDPIGLYTDAVAAGVALYGGSTASLRTRLADHLRKLEAVELAACDPVAVVLPTTGPYARGHARLLEDLILASVPLAWNFPGGPLWGFGGNAQGVRRNAPPAPWWRVHGTTDPAENLVAAYHQWWAAQAPPVTGLLAR